MFYTPKFQRVSPAVVSGIGKMPTLPMLWLKNSQENLESINIGERLKIEDSFENLYFSKLKKVQYECWDMPSGKIWSSFVVRHREIIEDLVLSHCILLYDFSVMDSLIRLELRAFNYFRCPILSNLLIRDFELIIKGDGYERILVECMALGRNIMHPNITIAQFRPRRNIVSYLQRRFKINFIPLHDWEHFVATFK
ncbi:hypothetical protein DFJ63DRAFT_311816 [Scheffersomyces coipomensis]|uniref:uncharacterized protein n=1 Tax=Scheffersomyces coipomensis TaxID=1788519 RepID=UPI00315C83ED